MGYRYWRRRIRCFLKYGPHGCPHIERHGRRKRLSRAERKENDPPVRHRRVVQL